MPEEILGTVVTDAPAGGSDVTSEVPETPVETGGEGGPVGGDTPTDGNDAPDTPVDGESPDTEQDTEPEPEEFDGRQVDAKTRSALAKLKSVDPAAAKSLLETYHRAQAIVKDVGAQNLSEAMQKVRAMAATVEALGGEEGITNLNTEVEDYRREIDQFSQGDPALIQQLYEANPEGLATNVLNSLELLASKNIEAFDKAIIPAMVNRLENAGLYNALPKLLDFIKEGKGQEAFDAATEIKNWLDRAKGLQKKAIDAKGTVDPREKQFAERERALTENEAKQFDNAVGVDVNRMNNRSLAKVVEPFFKDIKLEVEGRREFVNGLQSRIWKQMREDKIFQLQAQTIKKSKDVTKLAEFTSAKFTELLPEAFRQYRNIMYPAYKAAPRIAPKANGVAKPGAPASKPEIKVAVGQRPRHGEINWNLTSDIDYANGIAILTNGKRVQFDKNAPANNPYQT